MSGRLSDPIGFELFRNTLLSIADEMALTILRTAYSGVLKDNMDYSTALCDAQGRTVAQGLTLPAHLSSFPMRSPPRSGATATACGRVTSTR